MSLRVFVCDDEPLAVRRLSAMLGRVPNVELVATADNGREALELLPRIDVDLLLLDIEMAEIDGFDVVEAITAAKLSSGSIPLVAFVTAYRRFAPQAFDSGVIDFLSKPVRQARLELTLNRAREALAAHDARRRLIDLQARLNPPPDDQGPFREGHVWIPRRGEMIRVDLDQVERVSAEGAYVRLHIGTSSFLHREPIGSIERKFDPDRYLRAHRSHIVRMDRIASIRRTLHGAAELVLRNGESVPVGRKYAREVRRKLRAQGSEA